MAAPTAGSSPSSSPSPGGTDHRGIIHHGVIPAEWPAQAADTIVDTISKVREKTTRPALVAARGVVYGLLALLVGTIGLILLYLVALRLWDNYMPGPVWTFYLLLFVVFTPTGLWLLKQANRPPEPTT